MSKETNTFLGGCRVLDITDERGHLCGKLLGDLGADVIKIEPPGGDAARNYGPFYKDVPDKEKSLYWFFTNLNKRGITLNLETTEGKGIFKDMAKTADLVIESFDPGYMNSLGLGYEELEKINPGIIMTSITPFGQTGPYAHYKVPDLAGVAMGGMVRLFGELDRQPNRISAPQFYYLGSIHGGVGSMTALYHREFTGEGQHVDVSCQQAVVLSLMISNEVWDLMKVNYRGLGPVLASPRSEGFPIFLRLVFPCKDGHVFAFIQGGSVQSMVESSEELTAMANREGYALELKDFDWTSVDISVATQEQVNAFQDPLKEYIETKTKVELFDEALKRDILLIPITNMKDVDESPQLAYREFWNKVYHDELDDNIKYTGWPVKWTEMPPYKPQRRAPLIGEHNHSIYEKELGLSLEQIILLKNQGVV